MYPTQQKKTTSKIVSDLLGYLWWVRPQVSFDIDNVFYIPQPETISNLSNKISINLSIFDKIMKNIIIFNFSYCREENRVSETVTVLNALTRIYLKLLVI